MPKWGNGTMIEIKREKGMLATAAFAATGGGIDQDELAMRVEGDCLGEVTDGQDPDRAGRRVLRCSGVVPPRVCGQLDLEEFPPG